MLYPIGMHDKAYDLSAALSYCMHHCCMPPSHGFVHIFGC